MDGKDDEPSGPPRRKEPGHDIFCTPENSSFLSKTPYTTLDPTRREIRLLKVLSDTGSDLVECELLPSAPVAELRGKYLALSYCAGNPRQTETILVNGVKCNVFANLCHALTCARHFWMTEPRDEEFLLWADQICINQADLSERSHQVGFMRDIYQNAQKTLICLSTSNTQGEGMERLIRTYRSPGIESGWRRRDQLVYFQKNLTVIREQIIESPWWNRAWVFQEFMASAHAVFMSTYHRIYWREAQLALEPYIRPGRRRDMVSLVRRSRPFTDVRDVERAEKVWSMLRTKAEWGDTAAGLTFLLARSRGSKASDKRDRVYALLGLADPGYAIIPDYSVSNSLCHVLTETTKKIILFENTLDVLSVLTVPPLARGPGLPSWVVDWTLEEMAGPSNRTYPDKIESTPRRKGPAIASFRKTTHPETQQETTVMEVTGVFVKAVGPTYPDHCPLATPKNELLEVWNLCGSPCRFFLRRESYGYRIVRWINPGRPTRPENMSKGSVWNRATDSDSDSDSSLRKWLMDSELWRWVMDPDPDSDLWVPAAEPTRAETANSRVISIF